ncbi:MAG: hypothetical protein A2Y62_21220 [Candidatus Fischerbacteria bacterium RBG_13_37_8]|uniref:Uncharacterized protein n=1 Tax=Candidatus Fischerbacteria bacterium RBG_13_37_8 TaxID=1817863 RepID=A0A1F5V4Y2_9BACT|nr:MAG: hypothetical protein A2Y62_21220 [Candidatus Fischerbacteria bacterium RBG_13_37_8]HJX50433.1 hypothetical protein [Candidatus Nanoarchaeia archaeon]
MKINFKVFIKSEDRYVSPLGFVIIDDNIIRLYYKIENGMFNGFPYKMDDIIIEQLEVVE